LSKKIETNYFEELISVILPTYNSSKTIKRTIESIYNQKIDNPIEIIIVDDNSSDKTVEIIKNFSSNKKIKLRCIKNETNMGSGYCRKIAIDNAIGFFIAFLDSDDYWLRDKLYKQLNFLQRNPNINFVYSDYLKEINFKKKIFLYHMQMPKFISAETNRYINHIPNSSVLIKSNIAKKIHYPLIRLRNDFLYWNKILLSDKFIKAYNSNLGEPLFIYGSIQGISKKNLNLILKQWELYRIYFKYSIFKSLIGLILNVLLSLKNIISFNIFLIFK